MHQAHRHADDVAAILHRPFHAFGQLHRAACSVGIHALDAHDLRIGSHTGLRACRSVASHGTSTVCAVSHVVHRVIIVVAHIVAVMRKRLAAVPKVIGQVQMVVVDACIND